jgi:hypothetical protein
MDTAYNYKSGVEGKTRVYVSNAGNKTAWNHYTQLAEGEVCRSDLSVNLFNSIRGLCLNGTNHLTRLTAAITKIASPKINI